ncbi:hypothetical protein evm_013132 [Chilo suppressalis]|nr:hypothetical protein evm_013132 [Chilo suppressalis]
MVKEWFTYSEKCGECEKLADNLSGVCKAMDKEVVLMFANGPEIRAFVQDKNEEFDVITSEKRIEAIDYDPIKEMVFWADSYDKTIKRSYMVNALDGQAKTGFAQDLNMKGNAKPTALAVDYVGDNLYWTEVDRTGSKPRGRVMVARTDGRYRRALVSAGIENPTSIVLDPQMGRMFWGDAGSAPKIEIAWMDGSKRWPLVTENIRHPAGLAIDMGMDHSIYWADTKLNTIEMMKFDGTNRKVVVQGEALRHPLSLDVFESSLYWVTRDTGELVRQDKFGRGVPFVISKDLVNPSAVKEPVADYVKATVDTVIKIHENEPLGNVLAFLTSQEEIHTALELLNPYIQDNNTTNKHRTHFPSGITRHNLEAVPLYGSLPHYKQAAACGSVQAGVRRVILATNVAETALTIPHVCYGLQLPNDRIGLTSKPVNQIFTKT